MMIMSPKVILIIQALITPMLGFCQSNSSLEQQALEFFCEIYQNYDQIMDADVVLGKRTNEESSRVYDVAYCFGEINLLTYQEGDLPRLDSLDLVRTKRASKELITCGDLKKTMLCWKKKYLLNVYQSQDYFDGKKVVEISLFHSATGQLIIFAALFDDTAIIDHCFESMFIN